VQHVSAAIPASMHQPPWPLLPVTIVSQASTIWNQEGRSVTRVQWESGKGRRARRIVWIVWLGRTHRQLPPPALARVKSALQASIWRRQVMMDRRTAWSVSWANTRAWLAPRRAKNAVRVRFRRHVAKLIVFRVQLFRVLLAKSWWSAAA
jgi:hypothetical protein